jgi:hypothetical protein
MPMPDSSPKAIKWVRCEAVIKPAHSLKNKSVQASFTEGADAFKKGANKCHFLTGMALLFNTFALISS